MHPTLIALRMKEPNARREFLKVPSILGVYSEGFFFEKFLERRRALKFNKDETNRSLNEAKKLRAGGGKKKLPYRSRLVYVKRNPKNLLWWEYVMGGSYADPHNQGMRKFSDQNLERHTLFLWTW